MINHPVYDIGPDLLGFTLEGMEGMLVALRDRTDLTERQRQRLAQFSELANRYRKIQPLLAAFVLASQYAEPVSVLITEDGAIPAPAVEQLIKSILLPPPDEETTETLLETLSDAVTEQLRARPTTELAVKGRRENLPVMVAFYQIAHEIYFEFMKTPSDDHE